MKAQWMAPPQGLTYDMALNRTIYCNTCNGFFSQSMKRQHEDFHQTYTNRSDGKMSTVTWCDPGNHAFKTSAPGSVHFEGAETDENGRETNTSIDACVDHRPDRVHTEYITKELNSEYPVQMNND